MHVLKKRLLKVRSYLPAGVVSAKSYSEMQRDFYDRAISGSADRAKAAVHPDYDLARRQAKYWLAFILHDYADRRARVNGQSVEEVRLSIERPRPKLKMLDYGCGVGRMMEEAAVSGFDVDGVDISYEMLRVAKQSPLLKNSQFFLTAGTDCGGALEQQYDLAYSVLCFQHICVRAIRLEILRSIRKCLKKEGVLYIQMHFFPGMSAADVNYPHAAWHKDKTNAIATNSGADVMVTGDQLGEVYADFTSLFFDVRIQFASIPESSGYHRYHGRRTEQMFVSASVSPSLYDQIFPSV